MAAVTAAAWAALAAALACAFGPALAAGADNDADFTPAPHDMRMSRLVHMPIADRNGQPRGEVGDLIVDASEARVRYAVVDVGGFLGIGEHRTTVPMDRVRSGIERGHVVIDMTARELRALPGAAPIHGAQVRTARKLLHARVRDGLYRDVGRVRDIVLDLDTGKLRYWIVRFDPSWWATPRLVMLQPAQVSLDNPDGDLVLLATEAELRAAPTFEPGGMGLARRG